MEERMKIVVPDPNSRLAKEVLPGSGVVSRLGREGWCTVYYEGNKYGAPDLATWEQRVKHAWGRATESYPTTAMQGARVEDVIVVGEVDEDGELSVWRPGLVDGWRQDEAPWAARFDETWDGDDEPRTQSHLVIVWAGSAEAAQAKSGLTIETFAPATDDELDEWDSTLDGPLEARELGVLSTMVRRKLREIGRQRVRDRVSGRWNGRSAPGRDADRTRARRLTVLAAKLDELVREAADAA